MTFDAQVAAIRAAWFLNKAEPTVAEQAEYADKGFDTKDGFFAALTLLREAVALLELTEVGIWTPPQRERVERAIAAYDAATRPSVVMGGQESQVTE